MKFTRNESAFSDFTKKYMINVPAVWYSALERQEKNDGFKKWTF